MADGYDAEVIVIGSGAGGSMTAARLAAAGRDVLVLEEGPWIEPGTYRPLSPEELAGAYRHGGLSVALGLPPVAFAEGRCVGGSTEINSGLYHRPPAEVVERWASELGILQLDPDDLTKRAERIETEVAVSTLPGDAPVHSAAVARGAEALGWGVVEVPRLYRYDRGRDEKQSMTQTLIPKALAAGARIESDARVQRVVPEGSKGVRVVLDGQPPRTLRARYAFVCAGAVQSPALLLRSGARGLGHGLKMHPTVKVIARMDEPIGDRGMPVHQVKEFAPGHHDRRIDHESGICGACARRCLGRARLDPRRR